MYEDDLLQQIYLSSIPLYRLINLVPIQSTSGCLIDYCEQRLLLTVEHGLRTRGDWVIQIKYVPGQGTKQYRLGEMNFLDRINIFSGDAETLDFSYAIIPNNLIAYRQVVGQDGKINLELPITIFSLDFSLVPDTDEIYGFSGYTNLELENHLDRLILDAEVKVVNNLRYRREEEGRYVFSLPIEHPGHNEFKGCSGAPIIDSSCRPVALLTGGCASRNEVYGIPLNQFKTPIDILVGNL